MVYSAKQTINSDEFMDRINSNMGVSAIDWEARAIGELFNGIGQELKKNMSHTVRTHDDSIRGLRELELRIVAYPKKTFDDKLKYMSQLLDKGNVSSHIKSEIIRMFLEDEPDFRNEKTYI